MFRNHCTQWRAGMGGPTGLDYGPVYAALARMGLSNEDHDCMFADVQHMEYAALAQMKKDRPDER